MRHLAPCLLALTIALPANATLPPEPQTRANMPRLIEQIILAPPPAKPTCASIDQDELDLRLEVVNEVYVPGLPDSDRWRRNALEGPLTRLVEVLDEAGEGDMIIEVALRVSEIRDKRRYGCR